MKLCLLLLPLLALLPLSSSNTLSPVIIKESDCQAYTSWSLSMADPTGTATTSTTTTSGTAFDMLDYTGATLEYNGVTYTSQYLYFKAPAEHILPQSSTAYAAELQIEMMSSTGGTGIVSFLIQQLSADSADNTNWLQAYFNSPYYTVLSSFTSSNWDINLQTLSDLLNARITTSGFLNFYNYDGSLTRASGGEAEWFVQGSVLYATPTVMTDITTNVAATVTSATTSLATTRICFTGYFDVYMNQNYGLWFGVVSILLFFIFTLIMGDKPIDDPDYHEDVWTHHPIASVYKYGNELHTRKSRCSLILIMVTMHALFSSVFFRKTSDPTRASNVIVYAIYATLIDMVVTFFLGNMLRRYYLAKYQFAKTHEEAWEQKSQNRLFAYYILVFGLIAVGWSFCVWNMGELHAEIDAKASNLWVAAFFIGLGLEFLIVYPLACFLARGSNFIRRIIKSVGFMYDNICHETYLDYIKQD